MLLNASVISVVKKTNKLLERLMVIITPLGVILGLILGEKIAFLKPAVSYLFGIMTFSSAIAISIKDFSRTIKRPKFIFCFWLSSTFIMPILALLIASIFFKGNTGIISGFVLIRAIPSAVVGTIWASMFSGNMAIALSILIVDTILAPFITPQLLKILLHSNIPLDTIGMMKSLLFMVVIPSLLGMALNQITKGKINDEIGICLKPVSKIFLIFVIMINIAQISKRLIENVSWQYLSIAIISLSLVVLGYIIGYLFTKLFKFSYKDSVSITFSVAMRNVSAALVLAINYLPPEGTLPVIFGIVFQQSISAIMGKALFKEKAHSQE